MRLGTVAMGRAGRDKGGWFVVIGWDGDFALIADGKSRPLSHPKRKRTKHLAPTQTVLAREDYETDRRLRKALAVFGACTSKEV